MSLSGRKMMIRKATRAAYHFDPISLESTISIGHGHGWFASYALFSTAGALVVVTV